MFEDIEQLKKSKVPKFRQIITKHIHDGREPHLSFDEFDARSIDREAQLVARFFAEDNILVLEKDNDISPSEIKYVLESHRNG